MLLCVVDVLVLGPKDSLAHDTGNFGFGHGCAHFTPCAVLLNVLARLVAWAGEVITRAAAEVLLDVLVMAEIRAACTAGLGAMA